MLPLALTSFSHGRYQGYFNSFQEALAQLLKVMPARKQWMEENRKIGKIRVLNMHGTKTMVPLVTMRNLLCYPAYLFILPCTSLSSMKHSIFKGMDVALALMSFFSFSHSVVRRSVCFARESASTLYRFLNSSAKCNNS